MRGVRARAVRPASSVSDALADADEPGAGAAKARTGSSDESEIPREADVDDIETCDTADNLCSALYQGKASDNNA
eukprot:8296699-Lingulodinium_polyedra.AAC.1